MVKWLLDRLQKIVSKTKTVVPRPLSYLCDSELAGLKGTLLNMNLSAIFKGKRNETYKNLVRSRESLISMKFSAFLLSVPVFATVKDAIWYLSVHKCGEYIGWILELDCSSDEAIKIIKDGDIHKHILRAKNGEDVMISFQYGVKEVETKENPYYSDVQSASHKGPPKTEMGALR